MAQFTRRPRFRRFTRGRRFRRNRSTWFPTLGTTWGEPGNQYHDASWSDTSGTVDISRADGLFTTQFVLPITKDFTQLPSRDSSLTGPSLRDEIEGQTWRLDRLVGNIVVTCNAAPGVSAVQPDPDTVWQNIQVACGFFTARALETPGEEAFPDLTGDEYDPLNVDNIQNPWIWRRTWILRNPFGKSPADFSLDNGIPNCNIGYGPNRDTEIDTKIKRRVPREHRLWFTIGALGWNGNQVELNELADTGVQPVYKWNLDLRVVGSLQRARNLGTF